jgi:hypothetical protein
MHITHRGGFGGDRGRIEEFEHRGQEGFARWLAAGRTGSDPGRYPSESSSIDPESRE